MKRKVICGIQQVGIGVEDCVKAFRWYHDNFGYEIKVLDDEGVAAKMLPYTGGKPQPRRAIMAFNVRGGGGFEIWQPKDRPLNYLKTPVSLGDLGTLIAKIKTPDVEKARQTFLERGLDVRGEIRTSPTGVRWFPMRDPWGNDFQIEQDSYVFVDAPLTTGGANGVVIGVSDMQRSIEFYGKLLDYDKVVFDSTGVFEDLKDLEGGSKQLRRVVLQRSRPIEGPLSPIMGTSSIELVQAMDGPGKKLYEGRFWGDPGYIHLCFDVRNMDLVQAQAESLGHPFVCDSGGAFDMGDANGHFTYVEDPDGALIEFVETFKVPIVKKLGIAIDMRSKDDVKPYRFLKAIRFLRVK